MKANLEAWLTVLCAPGIGAVRFHRLFERFKSSEKIIHASTSALRSAGVDQKAIHFLQSPPREIIARNLSWAAEPNHVIRTCQCPQYPAKLKELKDAPPLLFIKGREDLLHEPQVAVVGSRHPTPGGQANARDFASGLAQSGLLVTSGMASGVDAIAHQAALDAGGATVAVIATGQDIIYPAKNKPLAERIAKEGVLVSEFAAGVQPLATNFPRRNRLISALSLGVVVVEAKLRSGALITARTAGEQGREVFAVPGSIRNPNAQGCHHLIQQGAKLVEGVEDILVELKPQIESILKSSATPHDAKPATVVSLEPQSRQLLECMGFDSVTMDALVDRSGLPVQTVSALLMSLELEGYVSSENNIYIRIQ